MLLRNGLEETSARGYIADTGHEVLCEGFVVEKYPVVVMCEPAIESRFDLNDATDHVVQLRVADQGEKGRFGACREQRTNSSRRKTLRLKECVITKPLDLIDTDLLLSLLGQAWELGDWRQVLVKDEDIGIPRGLRQRVDYGGLVPGKPQST